MKFFRFFLGCAGIGLATACLPASARASNFTIFDDSFSIRYGSTLITNQTLAAVWGTYAGGIFTPNQNFYASGGYGYADTRAGSIELAVILNRTDQTQYAEGTSMALAVFNRPELSDWDASVAKVVLTDSSWTAPAWAAGGNDKDVFFTENTTALVGSFLRNGGNEILGLFGGLLEPGPGGQVAATSAGVHEVAATVRSTGSGANRVTLQAGSGKTLELQAGLSGSGEFQTTGPGTVRLQSNSGDFTGALEVAAGTVVVDGTLSMYSQTEVSSGGVLGGTGQVGVLQIAEGGILSPGNSPGTLKAASTSWESGGIYRWDFSSFLGTAGTHWDLLDITGVLSVNSSAGSPFLIDIVSLLPATGPAPDLSTPLEFVIATASMGITGFSADKFLIQVGSLPTYAGGGIWGIQQSSNQLLLTYSGATAIPEPVSANLLLLAGALGLAVRRKFRPQT